LQAPRACDYILAPMSAYADYIQYLTNTLGIKSPLLIGTPRDPSRDSTHASNLDPSRETSITMGASQAFFESTPAGFHSIYEDESSQPQFVFTVVADSAGFGLEEQELFYKILEAVKIPSEQRACYLVSSFDETKKQELLKKEAVEWLVYFSSQPVLDLRINQIKTTQVGNRTLRQLWLNSPQELVLKPDLKKITWKALKGLMGQL
jgi:hypothetical protein